MIKATFDARSRGLAVGVILAVLLTGTSAQGQSATMCADLARLKIAASEIGLSSGGAHGDEPTLFKPLGKGSYLKKQTFVFCVGKGNL